MNEESSYEHHRFLSSYDIEKQRFWVLTTADRSRTWVLTTANRSSTTVSCRGDAGPDPAPPHPYRQKGKHKP
jgi:hypothetical protein